MKNLHQILATELTTNVWIGANGTETPMDQLDRQHMDNIIRRFAATYLQGRMDGPRKEMFEGVIQEWHRRYTYIPWNQQ